jgi:hypothetical protein
MSSVYAGRKVTLSNYRISAQAILTRRKSADLRTSRLRATRNLRAMSEETKKKAITLSLEEAQNKKQKL